MSEHDLRESISLVQENVSFKKIKAASSSSSVNPTVVDTWADSSLLRTFLNTNFLNTCSDFLLV
jgi:hypothetical protein